MLDAIENRTSFWRVDAKQRLRQHRCPSVEADAGARRSHGDNGDWKSVARKPEDITYAVEFTSELIEFMESVYSELNLVYPPGIAVIVPGERYTERCKPMIDYFKMFEEGYARFPGFANEIQGVYGQQVEGRTKLFTYVTKD